MMARLIPPHEKKILEAHVRKVALRDLAFATQPLDEYQNRELKELIRLRMQGLPLQYLTGSQDFFGREFYVNTAVLVPRPETEGLVEIALKVLRAKGIPTAPGARGLDFGTGSGCIAATLCLEFPSLRMLASDSQEGALEVAAENLQRLKVRGTALRHAKNPPRLEDYQDLNDLDFIVSNPPYLTPSDDVAEDVRAFEPDEALYAPQEDPLAYYRFLLGLGNAALRAGGFIALELAHDRAEDVRELAGEMGFQRASIHDDLTGRPRYCLAFKA